MCVVLGMEPKASSVADKCSISELWVQSCFYFSRQGLTKLPCRPYTWDLLPQPWGCSVSHHIHQEELSTEEHSKWSINIQSMMTSILQGHLLHLLLSWAHQQYGPASQKDPIQLYSR